ncbi:hypothetical protein GFK26_18580 [Variovorax paradoxus]|uniref:Uncharacterized protein n=1 Tax=Variovorax paradoxus TaxID=34073 RepID=A0A5Q0M7R0_VARPD|nr:hypothetical protein [Variovorax paradoxus]QFZ84634.1 hypothetical protein GFK26_18580 [Variovorax paradoxus]
MATTLTKKTFDELFVFLGSEKGSFVNAQGFVQPKPTAATPRFDFDPVSKTPRGLLIESPRTNLLRFSSRFDSGVWSKVGVTVVPGAALAPNGRWDACKLALLSGSNAGASYTIQALTKSEVVTTYALSLYVKAAGSSNGYLYARGATSANSLTVGFNVATMTASSSFTGSFAEVSRKISDAGGGWRRIEMVFTTDASAVVATSIYPGSASGGAGPGDGNVGIYIWGAQLEEGKFASSYIYNVEGVTARASIGSYYDVNGVMRYAAAGVSRESYEPSNLTLPPMLLMEEQRTNLLQRTADMHLSPWTGGAMTRTPGKLAPDGTFRAVEFSGTSTSPNTQNAVATATVMTYSIYLKNVSRTGNVELLLRNTATATNGVYGIVTLHGSTPSISGAGWEMRDVGGGWYRCIHTSAIPITIGDTLTCYAVVAGARSDNGACLAWGAQLEAGAFATSYIPSTETFTGRASIGTYFDSMGAMKTAAAGVARMTYNPADLTVAPWLLLEGASANMLTESEFRNGLADAPVRLGCAVAPWNNSGFTTGLAFPAAPPVGTFAFYAAQYPVLTPTTTYVFSCFVKMDDGNAPNMPTPGGAGDFALVIGNAPVVAAACTMTHVGGGVYRVTGTQATGATVPSTATGIWKYGTNTGRTFKFTGFQLEQASSASSYIPTTTATVTRAADSATTVVGTRQADTGTSIATTRSGDGIRIDTSKGWFNPAEGTLFMELEVPKTSDSGTRTVLEFGSVGGGRMGVSFGAASTANAGAYGYSVLNAVTLATPGRTLPAPETPAKIAVSYGSDGIRFAFGNMAVTKVASAVATGVTHLGIGNTAGIGNQPFFRVRALRYRPQKLTDAEVVALTT